MPSADKPAPINLLEYEDAARVCLSAMAYDYFAGGAADEVTLRENRAAFDRLSLLPRVLVDISQRDYHTIVLGHPLAFPAMIAPAAFMGLAHPEAELPLARAAARSGTVLVASSFSNQTMEAIAGAAGDGVCWFQLYAYKDQGFTRDLVERSIAAGYKALVITVDLPVLGRRERDIRSGFHLPAGLTMANFAGEGSVAGQFGEGSADSARGLAARNNAIRDDRMTWREIEWFASTFSVPVIPKGIVRPDDARRAFDHGAAAIMVSNHGGRQLDTVVPPIDILPAVVEAVAGRGEVYLDGGIRRGTDVLKAVALGARAVLVGRPIVWALAVNGEDGVEQALQILGDEFDVAAALCGCRSVAEITPDLVYRRP